MKKICLYAILGIIICGYWNNLQAKPSLRIQDVRLDRKVLDLNQQDGVNLEFKLTDNADVKIYWYDWFGNLVKTSSLASLEAGIHNINWDCRGDDGRVVAGDVFLYVIEAKNGARSFTYNTVKETGGIKTNAIKFNFNKNTGEIEYVLPKACMIRIYGGLNNNMFASNILPWTPQSSGRHHITWDGKDDKGLMNLLKHKDVRTYLRCYTLPDNCLIVKGSKILTNAGEDDLSKRKEIWQTEGKDKHYNCNPDYCRRIIPIEISFPSSGIDSKGYIHTKTPLIPVKVEVSSVDAEYLTKIRFEAELYVDGILVQEVKDALIPMTFLVDENKIGSGSHVITVNLKDYQMHIAIESCKIIVGEKNGK